MTKNIEPNNITLTELAKYRRQSGFSSRQIADGMHVSLPIVQYIEQGEFDKIGAAPFIRGHVINYCKYLGLDVDMVLTQLPEQLLSHKNVQRPDAFLPASVSKVRLKTNHYGRYAVGTSMLAVLMVSAYFVWDKWGLVPGQDSPVQLIGQNNETVTYSSILPPVSRVETLSQDAQADESTSLNQAEAESEEVLAADQVDVEIKAGLQSVNDEVVDQSTEADNSVKTARFVVEFDIQEAAWVSVKTEAGDNIVHDLIGPGVRRYESDVPMTFRLGNAAKLSLSINGESVNVLDHAEKDLAKFSWPLGS